MTLQYYLGHDEHAHPLQSLHRLHRHGPDLARRPGTAPRRTCSRSSRPPTPTAAAPAASNPLTGRAIEQLQPKRKQAEYFAATGRAPGGVGGGDPGVQRETTGDTAGGFQNIGFIEDGDWWSFDPTNLTGIDAAAVPGRLGRRRRPDRGARRRRRRRRVLGHRDRAGHRRLAGLHRRHGRPDRRRARPAGRCSSSPATRPATGRAACSTSTGSTSSAAASPTTRRRRSPRRRPRRPAPRRSRSRSPARPPTRRATPR